jgi:hypothetical protein
MEETMASSDNESNNFSTKKEIVTQKIKINRINPDNLQPIFVNDFLITNNDEDFFLTFSVLEPQFVETEEELKKVKSVQAIARVKLALNPVFMKRVTKAITNNVEAFEMRSENAKKITPKE